MEQALRQKFTVH